MGGTTKRVARLLPGTILILLAGAHKGKRVVYLGRHNPSDVKQYEETVNGEKFIKRRKPNVKGKLRRISYVKVGSRGSKRREVTTKTSLSSPLLLVTGPYALNRVPLRRVNPRYVIATSTRVDLKTTMGEDLLNKVCNLPNSFFTLSKKEKLQKLKKEKKDEGAEGLFIKQTNEENKINDAISPEKIEFQKSLDEGLVKMFKEDDLLKKYMSSLFGLRNNQYPHEMKF